MDMPNQWDDYDAFIKFLYEDHPDLRFKLINDGPERSSTWRMLEVEASKLLGLPHMADCVSHEDYLKVHAAIYRIIHESQNGHKFSDWSEVRELMVDSDNGRIRDCAFSMDKPSKEFLNELRRRAIKYGWNGDYTEVATFVKYLYKEAGIEITDEELEPC